MSVVLNVLGSGVVTPSGRGWECQPSVHETSSHESPACALPADALSDRAVLKKLRRADRFSKMAALSGWDAVEDAGMVIEPGYTKLGIIATTALGPHNTTFALLDEILDYGDAGVSPTRFSHSVHNAAAAYVAIMLGSRGPASTVADFVRPLYAGCLLASVWLQEGRCQHALVSYTEELSDPMAYISCAHRAAPALQPLQFCVNQHVLLSEGSVSMVLSLDQGAEPQLDMDQLLRAHHIADVQRVIGGAA